MKLALIIFSIAFMFLIENNMAQQDKVFSPNLIDIIQSILNDPEYKALSYEQQLQVLIMLYNYLDIMSGIMFRDPLFKSLFY